MPRAVIDVVTLSESEFDKDHEDYKSFYEQFEHGVMIMIATGNVREDGTVPEDEKELAMETYNSLVPLPIHPRHLTQAFNGILMQVMVACRPAIQVAGLPGEQAAIGKKKIITH